MRRTSGWRTTSSPMEQGEGDAAHVVQYPARLDQAALLPRGRSIWVTSPVTTALAAEADAGEEHLHLLGRGVLRLVENDEGVLSVRPRM